jgi:hypothetical protein
MANLKVSDTLINIAVKKVLGKAHTSNLKQIENETHPSNTQATTQTTFGESVPNEVDTTSFFSLQSGTVEYIEFDVNYIVGTDYDEDSYPGTGGSESSDNTYHGYYLSLPSDYEASSSNPNAGTGFFVDSQEVFDTRGKLQLVPPFLSNAAANKYNLSLYDQTNTRIYPGDDIDWTIDYYNGIIFVQDPLTTKVPTKARAFLYVGEMADEVISGISVSGSSIAVKDEGSTLTSAATSFDFVGAGVTATNSGGDVTVTINGGASGFSRTAVTSTITASVSDRILGVSASAALEIRLPDASTYSNGQFFTVKDEAGNADVNSITILTSNSQTIDGVSSITLESPYSAINIYTDGSQKFFIY